MSSWLQAIVAASRAVPAPTQAITHDVAWA